MKSSQSKIKNHKVSNFPITDIYIYKPKFLFRDDQLLKHKHDPFRIFLVLAMKLEIFPGFDPINDRVLRMSMFLGSSLTRNISLVLK